MEKRTILAFILMLLVLFLYQTYFSPKPQEVKEKVAGTERVEKKAKEEKIVPETPLPKATAKEMVVENEVFKITFTEAGGGIRSVKLKKYRESVKENKEKEILEDIGPYLSIPAFRLISEEKIWQETSCQGYASNSQVKDKPEEITFKCDLSDGGKVKKTYRLYPSEYVIDLKIEVEPKEKARPAVDIAAFSIKRKTYNFKGPVLFNGRSLEQVEKIDKKRDVRDSYKYAGLDEGYFAVLWIPELEIPDLTIMKSGPDLPVLRLSPKSGSVSGRLFFGPKKTEVLKSLNVKAEKIIDFGWFDIIAKPLVMLLNLSHRMTKNYGIDIILLTILIKIIFHPLTLKSYKSMKEMQRLQPQIMKLREKYKDNREKLNQELMELYRRRGINPMSGCLPMLIQIPVFFALYKALTGAIELRHAPFFLWIRDLSEPEDLFSFTLLGFSIPVRILPLVMGVTQVIQQKMTPTGGDPMQEKIMLFMPIFFTFLFWGFPSGLVLYWLVNNVVSIFQQLMINKKVR
jgi:YidC/Oxa1 family membrane protein insertase